MTLNSNDLEAKALQLATYVSDAAAQRLLMEPRLEDQEFTRRGGKLFYSIDTDVITQFLDPYRSVTKTGQRPRAGYAQIFRNDPPHISIALGRAITTYIFFENRAAQLILFPPLEQEVQSLYLALLAGIDKQQKEANRELDNGNLNELVTAISAARSDDEKLDAIIVRLPAFTKFIFGLRGPTAEMSRLNELLQKSNLFGLEQYIDSLDADNKLRDLLLCPRTIGDWIKYSDYKSEWQAAIQANNRARPTANLERDASVLARVELLNSMLVDFNCRIVHISGDQAMHTAAGRLINKGGNLVYSPHCLRHPRAFLAERGVLFSGQQFNDEFQSELQSWLEVFLADYTDDSGITRPKLDRLLATSATELEKKTFLVCQRDPTAATSFADQWHKFVDPVAVKHSDFLLEDETTHIRRLSATLLRNGDHLVESLEAIVNSRVIQTWELCFEAATATGLSLVRINLETEELPSRAVPPVTFDRFSATRKFVEALERRADRKAIAKGADYRKMITEIRNEDPTRYTFYLAFAVLFAAAGKWYTTQLLCERAISIAERQPSEAVVSGREAYYLSAVTKRLLAKSEADLDDANRLLNKAVEALERDHNNFGSLQVSSVRFDRECIAQSLAHSLFKRFVLNENPGTLSEIVDHARKLLVIITAEKDGRVHSIVERGAVTSLLMSALILVADTPQDAQAAMMQTYSAEYEVFRENLGKAISPVSYLQRAVFITTQAFFSPPRSANERHSHKQIASRLFSDKNIFSHSVTPYDAPRLRFLRNLCFSWLSKEHKQ